MNTPDIRYYLVRLTTKALLEAEESGTATILLTRTGPEPDNECATVEDLVTTEYQNKYDRVVVSATAMKVSQDTYNTQRIMLSSKINKVGKA